LDSGVKETILFSLEEKMKLALKILKNHFSGLGSEDAIEGLKSAGNLLEMEGWNLSIFYTLLLTRILIYPPTLVFPKWNRFICI
jgi:hypothetical protein